MSSSPTAVTASVSAPCGTIRIAASSAASSIAGSLVRAGSAELLGCGPWCRWVAGPGWLAPLLARSPPARPSRGSVGESVTALGDAGAGLGGASGNRHTPPRPTHLDR